MAIDAGPDTSADTAAEGDSEPIDDGDLTPEPDGDPEPPPDADGPTDADDAGPCELDTTGMISPGEYDHLFHPRDYDSTVIAEYAPYGSVTVVLSYENLTGVNVSRLAFLLTSLNPGATVLNGDCGPSLPPAFQELRGSALGATGLLPPGESAYGSFQFGIESPYSESYALRLVADVYVQTE